MMEEINIDRAIDLLSSERPRQRSDGLADLKHILQQNKNSSKLATLNDKSCHKIFEALFRFITLEKSLYNRGNRPTAKTQSASRLSDCSSVLRLAVEKFLRNIRSRTVKAVVDHITQILSTPGEGLWEHLSNDYIKALKCLLGYPAHVEHLVNRWSQLVKFCLRGIGASDNEEGNELTIRSSHRFRSESADINGARSTPFGAAHGQSYKRAQADHSGSKLNTMELLTCLQFLTSAPNAPILIEAQSLLSNLTDYLASSSPSESLSQQPAFSALNVVLASTIADNIDLTHEAIVNVIPTIRNLWATKSVALKEEMLVTLTLMKSDLARFDEYAHSDLLVGSLESLVERIHLDYLKYLERGMEEKYSEKGKEESLQIEDLFFSPDGEILPMGIPAVGPRLGSHSAERNWVTVWTIANLSLLLDRISTSSNVVQSTDTVPHKKQRLLSRSEDILREAAFSTGTSKICALQLTPFLLAENLFAPDLLESSLGHFTASILDDNDMVASWTMIAIASLAGHKSLQSNNLKTQWLQVWELASRALAAPGTSRAACNLMTVILKCELLGYNDTADTIESMVSSVDLNGPPSITDSALSFWSMLMKLRTKANPSLGPATAKQICGWLRGTWTLWTLADRSHTTKLATFASPAGLLELLLTCTDRSFSRVTTPLYAIPGRIGKAWFSIRRNRDLVQYLHLTNYPKSLEGPIDSEGPILSIDPSTRHDPNDQIILELLQTKIESFSQTLTALSDEKAHNITIDFVHILVSLCLTTSLFIESLPSPPSYRCQDLQKSNLHLWGDVCTLLSRSADKYVHASLETLAPFISISQPQRSSQDVVYNGLHKLANQLIEVLEDKRAIQRNEASSEAEPMDLDEGLHYSTRSDSNEDLLEFDREDLPIFGHERIFQLSITIQLSVFYRYLDQRSEIPSNALIDYLSSFDEADILSARRLLPNIFLADSGVSRDNAYTLLEYYAEKCLQSYEFERCEAALCVCISLMSSIADLWTSDGDDDLSQVAFEMYNWLIKVLLNSALASPGVLIKFAGLLLVIIKANPDYPDDEEIPSPRTNLFKILQNGELPVKFYVSGALPSIFNRFILKDHGAIFEDVLESLPCDRDWIEGIAVRVYALARLASEWHTLLRQTIYYMVETPYEVPSSASHTTKCLQGVATSFSLQDSKEIFRLFSPQLLYTWMERRPINTIPFSIFGYLTLAEMLADIQDEVVGQIIMRASTSEATELSNQLNIPFRDILSSSFYKAGAYGLARDISLPPSQDTDLKSVQGWMKKLLGVDEFRALTEKTFPQIIATLFTSIDQEEQIERAISKRPEFSYALEALRDIQNKGSSAAELAANQQPSFRARFLLDELEFLCQRTGYDFETLWTPAMVSFVARSLFNSIHPSLGPLHACSVLRRLRILVCLAHSSVLQDYPLEMLLRELLPFLTNFHCSEDALGLFWYLMEKGRPYLLGAPSFLAGTAVSTLASLRGLLNSSQDSTTQESEFITALSKAKEFYDWFGKFLECYEFLEPDEELERSFRSIINSSQRIELAGNASKDTYESELLVELLNDKASGRNLLSDSASELVLSFLIKDFKYPRNFREDIFGEDKTAAANAVVLWETMENRSSNRGYRLWAARVLGRAYASTGTVSDVLLREQDPRLFKDLTQSDDSPSASKVAILHVLSDMLLSTSRSDIGLVERTLQLIITRQADFPGLDECEQAISPFLMKSLQWMPYECPELPLKNFKSNVFEHEFHWNPTQSVEEWARDISLFLALLAAEHPIVGVLPKILDAIPCLSIRLLPYILHETLLFEIDGNRKARQDISNIFHQAFSNVEDTCLPHTRLMINCILYLRNQPLPNEATISERDTWLEIDFMEAASAARRCRMYKTSLLFAEIQASRNASSSRRSSVARNVEQPLDLLHDIFKNIDDPDLIYGVKEDPSLESVMGKLDHESSGLKNLSFQSASYDVGIKGSQMSEVTNPYAIIKALNSTNLQGVASAMFYAPGGTGRDSSAVETLLSTAMDLQQWDIPTPSVHSSAVCSLFKAFQGLNLYQDETNISNILDDCFLGILGQLSQENRSIHFLRSSMKGLGILTEIDETLSSRTSEELGEEWAKIVSRDSWFKNERFQDISQIISSHEALFSSIKHKDHLKTMLKQSSREAQLYEVKVIRESLKISREHEALQASLKSAILLSKLVEPCAEVGVNISAAAKYDLANVLWDQGEMTTSIRMLQQLREHNDLHKQAIPVSRAEVLANLGHHIAEARLEKPEAIIQDYLMPAIKELKGSSDGEEAGRVFHEFATFCDQQLQNVDGLEDFTRIEQLRDRKEEELNDLERMMKAAEGKERDQLKVHRVKTKQWFDLDDREYQRLKRSRESFLQQCLENYLLCLKACDTYKNDALRFCALWLDKSGSDIANSAVSKHIDQVPSRKFVPLMNQLSSRLLDTSDTFQSLLNSVVFRICVDHPYHGMYQIFASSKSKGGKDQTAMARHQAANKLVDKIKASRKASSTWVALHNSNIVFVRFAGERLDEKVKQGAKVNLAKSVWGKRLEQDATNQKIPPPTMTVDLRPDCDYSRVPRIVKFQSEFTVASGISAPKIVTALASDGLKYKQLFKGGNDDLRQDSIMEQVFEQVSNLLQDHRATRQRNLGIRTYKVLPLTSNTGIIEFVQNTIPLHEYLIPAHQRHYPKDMKPNSCRKYINDAQNKSLEQRYKAYRQVTDRFHPVMRFFFMERFKSPDDWFKKRLAYTRSTAAISILGHVLGLGDRHGHNILLDEKTGEVVHIDLGVAFEQGRVLPIPEVVPFRLTRDLVDGMGITGTEGVFRRCCEFTLEALRQDSYSIMTVLDVLRYDPLYSWSISPLRIKRMQDTQEGGGGHAAPVKDSAKANNPNEPSEADRALTVVEKKLGKTLSVTATVNELIQQATDERNLAVLYCGWAAYV